MSNLLMPSPRAEINRGGRHAEIKRRYAWQARSRNSDSKKPDRNRLLTLVRMRELERVFQHRSGRFLPDDDSGIDDFTLMAHHIAHLRGDVQAFIVAWARAWAPWMSVADASAIAARVMAEPQRFTADALAWRLRLSMAERIHLGITTIGAFDRSKAERDEDRRRRDRERKRASRAKNRSGRSRGRPKLESQGVVSDTTPSDRKSTAAGQVKNASAAVRAIAADGISDRATAPSPATAPPAIAVGTPSKWILVRVDAEGGVGNPIQQRKTRFPTAMRLTKGMSAYASECGYEPKRIHLMFEIFRNQNIAGGHYSVDWREVWFRWVDRQVYYDTEHAGARRLAYGHGGSPSGAIIILGSKTSVARLEPSTNMGPKRTPAPE